MILIIEELIKYFYMILLAVYINHNNVYSDFTKRFDSSKFFLCMSKIQILHHKTFYFLVDYSTAI